MTRSLRQRRTDGFAVGMALPAVLFLVLVIAFPLGYMLRSSFFKVDRFNPGTPEFFVGLQNYVDIFTDRTALASISNTFVFVIISVGIEFLLGGTIALLLAQNSAQRSSRGRWMRTIFLFSVMIAPIVAGLQWRWLMTDTYGVINSYLSAYFGVKTPPLWLADPHVALFSLILVDVWMNYPFVMLILYAALTSIPDELSESAVVDGATYWQRFSYITVPYILPSIVVVLLIRIMDAFRVFDTVYVLTRGGPGVSTETISMYTYQIAFTNLDFEKAGALSVEAAVLLIALSVLLARVLRKNESF